MGDNSQQRQRSLRKSNDYENVRKATIQENQRRLKELGVADIANSLKRSEEIDKTKRRKRKQLETNDKDGEYLPDPVFGDDVDQSHKADDTRVKVTKKVLIFLITLLITNYDNFISLYIF